MPVAARTRIGLSPLILISDVIIWISAVIVMGILSYFISKNNNQGTHIIYEEVIVCCNSLSSPRFRIRVTNTSPTGRPDSRILPWRLFPRRPPNLPLDIQPYLLIPLARLSRFHCVGFQLYQQRLIDYRGSLQLHCLVRGPKSFSLIPLLTSLQLLPGLQCPSRLASRLWSRTDNVSGVIFER